MYITATTSSTMCVYVYGGSKHNLVNNCKNRLYVCHQRTVLRRQHDMSKIIMRNLSKYDAHVNIK